MRLELVRFCSVMFMFVWAVDRRLVLGERLSEFVSHYEPLSYNRDHLEENHRRVRRSLKEDEALHLNFNAHGRHFGLRLKRDTSIFAPDLEVDSDFDPTKVYKGHVDGHPGSFVHGFVHNGIFEGKVHLSDSLHDEYHIEPTSDHFKTPQKFHSVMYKSSAVHYTHNYGPNLDLSEKTTKWMEEARKLSDEHFEKTAKPSKSNRYTRSTVEDKLICQMHLQADHLFTEKRARNSKERALLLMSKHVQAAHAIYSKTTFTINGQQKTGYGFAIKRMKANDSDDASDTNNPYRHDYIGVEKFLDIISLEEVSTTETGRFCLSHVFTYRDFEHGVLGLAWVGEPADKSTSGGICETPKRYRDGREKTLNTGVVTFLNYGKEVPSLVSEVTFAHELGHNFGAKHDTAECSDANGNFIMFPKATSGSEENNRKFSQCSVRYISPVIETKGNDCFKPTNDSICGNQVVEKGEECDCGVTNDDCREQCCYPAADKEGCKLHPNVECSPSQGLCCLHNGLTCVFANTTESCKNEECIEETFCNGKNASCPDPIPRPNNTDCDQNKSVCLFGACIGSRCLKHDKKECQCSKEEEQCKLCCESSSGCSPLNETQNMDLIPGAPCNNYQGYCDLLKKCRGVDSEGPLERIKNLLFGGEAIDNLVDWVKTYWWGAILIVIGLILLMAGFIKVCSVATPSSNPNKPKAKTMSLRRSARRNPAFQNEPPPDYDIEMGARQGGRRGKP